MVAINKYFAIAIVASVMLSVAFAQTDKPIVSTEPPAPQGGFIGGLGSKIISGIKSAGQAVISHIPFLNQTTTTTASPSDEQASAEPTEANAETSEAVSTEATEAAGSEAVSTEAANAEAQAAPSEQAESAASSQEAESAAPSEETESAAPAEEKSQQ